MDPASLVALIVLSGLAVGVALILKSRRPEPPTAPSYRAPGQLDRDDFDYPESERLIVVFSSSSCDSCAAVWDKVSRLEADGLAVQNVDAVEDTRLHQRYSVDGVPTTLLVGKDGAVIQSYFGPLSEAQAEGLTR